MCISDARFRVQLDSDFGSDSRKTKNSDSDSDSSKIYTLRKFWRYNKVNHATSAFRQTPAHFMLVDQVKTYMEDLHNFNFSFWECISKSLMSSICNTAVYGLKILSWMPLSAIDDSGGHMTIDVLK